MFSLLGRSFFRHIRPISRCIDSPACSSINNFCTKTPTDKKSCSKNGQDINDILGSIATKYQVFRNEESSIIFDINEERLGATVEEVVEEVYDEYQGLNLQRGYTGVYEIEDLVEALKRENGQDIFVAKLPSHLKYVDYICVVTGRSYRHMYAIAYFIRRLFKIKRHSKDILPKIEGENSKEWIAMDLGNIALHVFSNEARIKYDLDSLWSVGEEYDDECNKPDDPIVQLLQQHSIYLKDLVPNDN